METTIVVNGGIDLDVMVFRLQSGGIDAIKDYVIKSRPGDENLSWEVPLLSAVLEDNIDLPQIEAILTEERKRPSFAASIGKTFLPQGYLPQAMNPQPSSTSLRPFGVQSTPSLQEQHPGGVSFELNVERHRTGAAAFQLQEQIQASRPSAEAKEWNFEHEGKRVEVRGILCAIHQCATGGDRRATADGDRCGRGQNGIRIDAPPMRFTFASAKAGLVQLLDLRYRTAG